MICRKAFVLNRLLVHAKGEISSFKLLIVVIKP